MTPESLAASNAVNGIILSLRKARDNLIFQLQFKSAVFLSDKILALKPTTEDYAVLAKCLYRLKEYQRAAYIITCRNLHHTDITCCLLVIKCYFKCKNYFEASELAKGVLSRHDTKTEKWKVPLYVLQGLLYQALDNQQSAKTSLYSALEVTFYCHEAFCILTQQHMLTKAEEIQLLNDIIERNKESHRFLCSFMRFFYYIQLKKYDKPDELEVYSPFDQLYSNHSEFLVALAERHYYNCKYSEALEITTQLLKQDQYNSEGLLVHASTLMEFKNTNDLFELAQKLIDLYPEREISWYVLGCYYHLIEKVDLARRFLLKSTTLNCFFAPAWLLYGHSFSQESEHDQAISAFFKAAHFMPGCHLPLLYIGVEYILTDNFRLGEKFIMKALTIAPKDPLTLHELGIIAFNTNEVIKAERHFKAALSILKYNQNPRALPSRYDTLLNNMGHVKRKIGRPGEAIEFHKSALIMSPQNAPSYTAIGLIYCQTGKWKEAVNYLDLAHGLYKLQAKTEDPHTKTLLESHALKNYPYVCLRTEKPPASIELNIHNAPSASPNFFIEPPSYIVNLLPPLRAVNLRNVFDFPAATTDSQQQSTTAADSSASTSSFLHLHSDPPPPPPPPALKVSELMAKYSESSAPKTSLRFIAR